MEGVNAAVMGMVYVLGGFAAVMIVGIVVYLRVKASGQMRGF